MQAARGGVTAYISNHIHSTTVGTAFAIGARGRVIRGATELRRGDAAFYGWLRGLEPLLRQAQKERRTWYYLDNGYFRPGHYDGYYRVTRNAYQHDGLGEPDPARLDALGVEIAPWRHNGRHVLICPPGELMARHMGFNAADWLVDAQAAVAANTDRPIKIRGKGAQVPLEADLADAWCMVTAYSNAAVEALVAGVPVFCTHRCAAFSQGLADLSRIEDPLRSEDRERWAGALAANQWTLDEMRAGRCAADLGIL